MCGVSAEDSFSKALSTSSRNGVPDSDSSSVRLKYSAHSSETVRPADSPLNAWPFTSQRVLPSSRALVVEQREAGLFQRLQIAPDGPRRDVAERRQFVDRHAGAARPLDLAQDRPLADDFGVAGHDGDSINLRM